MTHTTQKGSTVQALELGPARPGGCSQPKNDDEREHAVEV